MRTAQNLASDASDWSLQDTFWCAGLALIAACVWALHGFHGWLWRDDAVYLYGGQRLLDGVLPYVSIFDHKTPLAFFLCGLGSGLGRLFGADDVIGARALYFLLSAAAVGAVYAAARCLLPRRGPAILAALVLVAAWSFGREAVSGPNAKTPMVLFEALFLWAAMRGRWVQAGLWAGLATWTWQPGVCFIFAGAVAAGIMEPDLVRKRALIRLGLGVLLPTAFFGGWFLIAGAFGPLIEGSTLFNLVHLERQPPDLVQRVLLPLRIAATTNAFAGPLLLAGLASIPAWAVCRWRADGCAGLENAAIPLLVAFPFPFLWSFFDFQGAADFYPFLPFGTVGLALLLDALTRRLRLPSKLPAAVAPAGVAITATALLLGSAWLYHTRSENLLLTQRYAAALVDQAHGADAPITSIGLPEILVLQQKPNPNRYVFIINGIDNLIDASTDGGFAAWVQQLEALQPPLVAWGPTDGPHVHLLNEWLQEHYSPQTYGYWQIFERRKRLRPDP